MILVTAILTPKPYAEREQGTEGPSANSLKSLSAGFPLCLTMDVHMRRDNDIAQERRSIRTSWSAFGWIVTIFGLIALAGWLLVQ